jgi:hypothetical protein
LLIQLVAVLLLLAAAILTTLFKKSWWTHFDGRVSSISILRDPGKHIRAPYDRVVHILHIVGLSMSAVGIVMMFVFA